MPKLAENEKRPKAPVSDDIKRSRTEVLAAIAGAAPQKNVLEGVPFARPQTMADIRQPQKSRFKLSEKLKIIRRKKTQIFQDIRPAQAAARPADTPVRPAESKPEVKSEVIEAKGEKLDEKTKKLWQAELKAALAEPAKSQLDLDAKPTSAAVSAPGKKFSMHPNRPVESASRTVQPVLREILPKTVQPAVPLPPKYSADQIREEKKRVLGLLQTAKAETDKGSISAGKASDEKVLTEEKTPASISADDISANKALAEDRPAASWKSKTLDKTEPAVSREKRTRSLWTYLFHRKSTSKSSALSAKPPLSSQSQSTDPALVPATEPALPISQRRISGFLAGKQKRRQHRPENKPKPEIIKIGFADRPTAIEANAANSAELLPSQAASPAKRRTVSVISKLFWPRSDIRTKTDHAPKPEDKSDVKRLQDNFVGQTAEDGGDFQEDKKILSRPILKKNVRAKDSAAQEAPENKPIAAMALAGKYRPNKDKPVSHINPFENDLVAVKIEQAEKDKIRIAEQEKLKAEQEREERQRRLEKKKRMGLMKRLDRIEKKARRREARIARQLAWKRKWVLWRLGLVRSLKQVAAIAILAAVLAVFAYSILLFCVLRLGFDNQGLRTLSAYLPIPAFIGPDGLVNYYEYADIRDHLAGNGAVADVRSEAYRLIIENAIIARIALKHGLELPPASASREQVLDKVNHIIQYDHDINFSAWSRIMRIQELINKGEDFREMADRYGDDSGQLVIARSEQAKYEYYGQVADLKPGETSRIITASEGYYIFQANNQDKLSLYLNFAYVKTLSIQDYLNKEAAGYRIWSLVK